MRRRCEKRWSCQCRRRRVRAAPLPAPDEGRRDSRAAYCAVEDEAVREFMTKSASQCRQILERAISRCQFDGV